MEFENKYMFYAFAILPIIVLLYFITARWREKSIKKYGDYSVVIKLLEDISETKRIWKFILYVLVFALLIMGLINPMVGMKEQEIKRKGADIMICLDVSNSMNAEDLQPNRLDKSKQALSKLIEKLKGDRIGIIVFAGQSYVQLPITTDYAAAKLFLSSINTGMVPTQGTAIGNAIDLAVESFGKDEGKNKAIVVITDGENHEDDAIKAAEYAYEKNISVHTIGVGSEQGAPIPIYKNNVREGYRKDKDGNTIITKLNESALQEIAAAGNGIFVRATNADVGLKNILQAIDELDKKEFESKMYSDYEDQFQWFVIFAFVLIIIETFLSERKSKLYKRLNLFEAKK
jgi:Ca-activated chloride channel family protein